MPGNKLLACNISQVAIAALVATALNGCAVVAVADAAVTVTATVVKVGAEAVGATARAVGAGVKALTKDEEEKKK